MKITAALKSAFPALAAFLFLTGIDARAANYQTVDGTFDYGYAQEVLQDVNIERAGQGLAPLVMAPELVDAAMKRAAELAVHYSHTRPNGSRCMTAWSWAGSWGENIASGQEAPWMVMDGWMNSPGHRANILKPDFKSIGVGYFTQTVSRGEGYDDEEVHFWAQVFSGGTGTSDKRTGTRDVVVYVGIADGRDSIVRDYTIAFSANGGSGSLAPLKVLYGEAVQLPANPFTRSGCIFIGWATSKADTKKGVVKFKNKAEVKNMTANGGIVALYAVWAKPTYKVAFNANGGTGKMAAQAMTYGKAMALRKNVFTKKGYVFAGWATSKANAKKGVIAYANAQMVKNLRTDGGTMTLYAGWAKPKYKVAFNANGGTGNMAEQTFKYGKAGKLAACKFKAPKGCMFAGWATSKAKASAGIVAFKPELPLVSP